MVMEDSVEEIFGISETDSMRHSKVWVCRKEKESGMSPMFWFGKLGTLITEREQKGKGWRCGGKRRG